MKKTAHLILLLLATALMAWLLPLLARQSTAAPERYPFVYYSSLLRELCIIDYSDDEMPLATLSGKRFSEAECDSLLPLFNFRQLLADGKLPDAVDGVEITPPLLRSKTIIFRHNPADFASPPRRLHVLFESMPRRLGLEMPPDVFRLQENIEFIDCESNRVNAEKSARFQQAFARAGYRFPARWTTGNPSPRKAYDEGYFSLDAAGKLFHLKMVNGKPHVRDTRADAVAEIAHFAPFEPADKRFYGFIFGRRGDLYILEARDGGYHPLRLDLDSIDVARDRLVIMGNLLYWNVSVTNDSGRAYRALRAASLQRVAGHFEPRPPDPWQRLAAWIFPAYLTLDSPDDAYLWPRLHHTGRRAWAFNFLLAAAAAGLPGNRRRRSFHFAYILVAGIAGAIALLLLPRLTINK
ncbi:MAG: DUF4857 domain-containing protein [Odoribacteraceae bacterium]|nr:DUF4857 domain-containing protein [Odoribacteraceae bacterium]